MGATHPYTWGVQTPRGISPASADDACAWLLIREDELVTLAGRLPLPTMGSHALEHKENGKRMKMACSPPGMRVAPGM